jgi:hypothetical protein
MKRSHLLPKSGHNQLQKLTKAISRERNDAWNRIDEEE